MRISFLHLVLFLVWSSQSNSSTHQNIVDYEISDSNTNLVLHNNEVSNRIVWDLSEVLECKTKFFCPPDNAYVELRNFEYEVLESPRSTPGWDILGLFYEFELIGQPSLHQNATLHFVTADEYSSRALKVNGTKLSICPRKNDNRVRCIRTLDYEAIKDHLSNSKPIEVATMTGITFFLRTDGIKEKIDASKETAMKEFEAAISNYNHQKLIVTLIAMFIYLIIVISLLVSVWAVSRYSKKLITRLKTFYHKVLRAKKANNSYKLGIAQELESLKRLEQQGEISIEAYEKAKQKLIAKM